MVAVAKSGANTLVLNGPNNYSGGTTVAGGMLIINNSNLQQTAAGTGFVTVSGGTFGGIGNLGDPGYSKGLPTFSVSAGAASTWAFPPRAPPRTTTALSTSTATSTSRPVGALDFDFCAGSLSQINLGYNGPASLNLPSSADSVAINLANLNGPTGELPLIQSTTAIANTSSLYIGTSAPAGDSYVLSYDSENNVIDLTISSTAANLTWAGTAGNNHWDVNTTPNFYGARQTFTNGDFVTFDDTGVGGAVSITIRRRRAGLVGIQQHRQFVHAFGRTNLRRDEPCPERRACCNAWQQQQLYGRDQHLRRHAYRCRRRQQPGSLVRHGLHQRRCNASDLQRWASFPAAQHHHRRPAAERSIPTA